jgi:hypothetical protein
MKRRADLDGSYDVGPSSGRSPSQLGRRPLDELRPRDCPDCAARGGPLRCMRHGCAGPCLQSSTPEPRRRSCVGASCSSLADGDTDDGLAHDAHAHASSSSDSDRTSLGTVAFGPTADDEVWMRLLTSCATPRKCLGSGWVLQGNAARSDSTRAAAVPSPVDIYEYLKRKPHVSNVPDCSKVWIWDLDETLIVFQSLLNDRQCELVARYRLSAHSSVPRWLVNGLFGSANKLPATSAIRNLGVRMANFIFHVCDSAFFFGQVRPLRALLHTPSWLACPGLCQFSRHSPRANRWSALR